MTRVILFALLIASASSQKCNKCGALANGKLSCCAEGGAWYSMCGAPGAKTYTWMEGIEACAEKEKEKDNTDDRKDGKCKECGALKSGTESCCAKGGSWYGSRGTKAQGKDYTWTEGIDACKDYTWTEGI